MRRLQAAWLLVGRERIAAHVLDVIESRIAHVDANAMQNLIEVEQAWLLGKVATPKRIGGGFARQRDRSATLGNETGYYHNLEVRHLKLDLRHRGPVVPPPQVHGLTSGVHSHSNPALWPDAQVSTPSLEHPWA